MLRVTADHPIDELVLELSDPQPARVSFRLAAGETAFLTFPDLPSGSYQLRIQERNKGLDIAKSAMTIEVRDPRMIHAENAGPLLVWAEPYSTSLDSLWEGRVAICVAGAAELKCRGRLTLAERPGGQPIAQRTFENVTLPMHAAQWRTLLRNQIQVGQELEEAYSQAAWARVEFEAGRYGRYALEFNRELPPVRWQLRKRGSPVLELIDDTESVRTASILHARFESPDAWLPLDSNERSFAPDPAGGIYIAQIGDKDSTIVVPPTKVSFSLRDLELRPRLAPRSRRPSTLVDLVETTQIWATARMSGNILTRAWRSTVVWELQSDLFSLVCGPEWRRAEFAFRKVRTQAAFETLRRLVVNSAAGSGTIAGSLVANAEDFTALPLRDRVDVFKMLTRRGKEKAESVWRRIQKSGGSAEWLAEFCLRAASDVELARWAGSSLEVALESMLAWPLPAKTARCIALWNLLRVDANNDFPPLLQAWDWGAA
jgi:hypothetical protein